MPRTIQTFWLLMLAAVAAVAIGAQLDRQSRIDPGLASSVPAPFRSFAQFHIAAAAIQNGSSEEAERSVRHLIHRRPVPAEHLSMLASAQLSRGATEQGLRTIQLAALRGWREPLAQQARLRLAISAGDWPEAANRLAALWAMGADQANLQEMTPVVLAEPAARHRFATILAQQAQWERAFLRRAPQMLEASTMLDLVVQTNGMGRNFACTGSGPSRKLECR